ncbi:hypothetical protein [Pseudomonas cedrina]|uniref:hypothetical protein n=1 Tax=Pseudomonas cedrina TaxID=651740 RepID=UPI00278245CD|nr:hypothetical protein [Pseudomonas cedrina]MDQ0655167.1 hypothetical protein [Pseudomonas cedrina]
MKIRKNLPMSSIQATEKDTSTFLELLESISLQQATICAQLDELMSLMETPSESVLEVLKGLLTPMQESMTDLTETLSTQLKVK